MPRLTLCINPDVKEKQHHGCAIMPKQRAAGGHRREDAARVLRFWSPFNRTYPGNVTYPSS
ncbi:hypothetical protein NYE59_32305 [Paenibacillus sp. FSL L8-0323]|uniref:hypothetical protein n=1 Tax=Paenibacillus TaxID=44249 RepID=UPI00117C252A|nr:MULTISPECIES: hypothetical protein [Paenibacillus]